MLNCTNPSLLDEIVVGRVDPHIYAFTTETIPNYLKVGDTYRPIEKRLDEWRHYYKDLILQDKFKAKAEDGKLFRDYSVHQFLEQEKGKIRLQRGMYPLVYYSNEFFADTNREDVQEAINDIIKDAKNNSGKYQFYSSERLPEIYHYNRKETFPLRPNQDETVKNFKRAVNQGRNNLLMYAVMRFGKSFTAMNCALALDNCKLVLIVSAKADVRSEWKKTIESHVYFRNFVFLDRDDLAGDEPVITNNLDEGKQVAVFLTLQDLKGNEIKPTHKEIFKSKIDLLIIDETHYGARASQLGRILEASGLKKNELSSELKEVDDEEDSEKNDAIVKALTARVKLHLSGTPYRILMGDEFSKEDIIAFCQFSDIVELQQQWEELRVSRDELKEDGTDEPEWENPYYGFPQMIRFAFRPNESSLRKMEELKSKGYTYAFSALLRPKSITKKADGSHKSFIHEQEILDLLSVIDGSKEDENLLGFLDYEKIKKGKMCHHMVFVLPYRASCDAMERLIKDHSSNFMNLSEYEIINISGVDNSLNSISNEGVKQRIRQLEEDGKKSITLTVNRMLTGSTVEQWDTMLYFKDTASPQEYDQSIFRLQNQFIRTYKDEAGNEIKQNMKPQTLLVDFDPDRMFRMQELKSQFFNVNTEQRGNLRLEERIEKELQISPIITLNHNKLEQVTPVNIMDAVRNYSQNKSIADEAQDIPFDFSLLDVEYFKHEIEDLVPINNNKGIEIRPISDDEVDEIDIPVSGDNPPKPEGGENTEGTLNPDNKDPEEDESKNEQRLLEKRFATYYSKILFFAFLTDNRVRNLEEIIKSIRNDKQDLRIAKNLGLKLKILSLIQEKTNAFILSKIDYKIQSINELMQDSNLEPIRRAEVAMTKFARFSTSEVVTPPILADELVSMLPSDILPRDSVFLDVSSVQGEIARALYKRYGEDVINNVYSIPSSALTYELTRKVYRLLGFPEDHIFTFTSTDLIGQNAATQIETLQNLKANVICSVPPFTEKQGGGRGDGGSAIYHKFFNIAKDSLNPQYISMMTQSTWYTGGRGEGLSDFRDYMLSINTDDQHIKEFHDYPDISAYIKGVTTLRGGICLFLWDRSYSGDCLFINRVNHHDYELRRPLRYESDNYHADFLIRWNKGLSILNKVLKKQKKFISDDNLMTGRNPFGFTHSGSDSWLEGRKKTLCRKYKVYLADGKIGYASNKEFTKEKKGLLKQWKVLIAKSSSGGDEIPHLVISSPIVSEPGSLTAHTHYVISGLKSKKEAVNLAEYMRTKFFRFMVNLLRSNQNMRPDMYQFAPRLDFSKQWTDKDLAKLYELDKDDVDFINMIVKDRPETTNR